MEKSYPNPLVFQRADPCIYRHSDGYYYFTASVPAYDCIEIRRSQTLAGLSEAETFVAWQHHKMGGNEFADLGAGNSLSKREMVYLLCRSSQ
ncbi:MAG: family 43 glycosylhydrolase [Selenomonas sp.]|nr:family 43 glycosylhydrolase [Selenomonas sp.]